MKMPAYIPAGLGLATVAFFSFALDAKLGFPTVGSKDFHAKRQVVLAPIGNVQIVPRPLRQLSGFSEFLVDSFSSHVFLLLIQ
jgi:hypothetical protein